MKICPDCGFENLDGNAYCLRCGKVFAIENIPVASQPTAATAADDQPAAPGPQGQSCPQGDGRQQLGSMPPPPGPPSPTPNPQTTDPGYNPEGYYPGGYRPSVHGAASAYADEAKPAPPYSDYHNVAPFQPRAMYDGYGAAQTGRGAYQPTSAQSPPPGYGPYVPPPRRQSSAGVIAAIIVCTLVVCAFLGIVGLGVYYSLEQSSASSPPNSINPGDENKPETGGSENTLPSDLAAYPQVWPDDLVNHYEEYRGVPVNTMGYVAQILRDEEKGCLLVSYMDIDQIYTFIVEGPVDIITDKIQIGDQLDLYGQITDVRTFDGEQILVFTCERADILVSSNASDTP